MQVQETLRSVQHGEEAAKPGQQQVGPAVAPCVMQPQPAILSTACL